METIHPRLFTHISGTVARHGRPGKSPLEPMIIGELAHRIPISGFHLSDRLDCACLDRIPIDLPSQPGRLWYIHIAVFDPMRVPDYAGKGGGKR